MPGPPDLERATVVYAGEGPERQERHTTCLSGNYADATDATHTEGNRSVSRRGKSVDAALDDLGQFMRGRRDFEDGVLWSKDKSPMWQAGYRQAIRAKKRDFGDDMITLKQRLLIKRVKPRFGRAA